MPDAACSHSCLEYSPEKHGDGWGARWVCYDCKGEFGLQCLEDQAQRHPKLTITRETSAEVRSVPSVGGCQVIVHPTLDGPGGMQTEILAKHINRADRLAPKCRLYCYEGIEEYQGRVQSVVVFYAMGDKETYDEARSAMTVGCEVTR